MNKKLWNTKEKQVSKEINSFLAGEDIILDNQYLLMTLMHL